MLVPSPFAWDLALNLDPVASAVLLELQRRGMTIQTLSRFSGVHRSVLSRWLAGRRTVKVEDAVKVMRVLGLEVRRSDT